MYERREAEIFWMKALAVVKSLQFAILQMMSDWFSCMVFNAVWLFFPVFDMNLAKFFQFYNYSMEASGSLAGILQGYSYYLNMMVSIKRIDLFMGAEDKEAGKVVDLEEAGDDGDGGDDRLGLGLGQNGGDFRQIVLKIENGSFRWRYENQDEKSARESFGSDQDAGDLDGSRSSELRVLKNRKNLSGEKNLRGEMDSSHQLLKQSQQETDEISGFRLRDINLKIKKGEKIAVIGRSNSGTSSLLYAMIGEMIPLNNTIVYKRGTFSYLSQSRWLMGSSIKDNILLAKPYNENLMNRALDAAQLLADLDQFSDGIETIISDSGDSVSGGQRARIALARSFYQDSDIMVLDDPTSSLDNKVTEKILDVILTDEKWSRKTYIVSTRKAGILQRFDRVIFMEDGAIKFFGEPSELKRSPVYRAYEKSLKGEPDRRETRLTKGSGQGDDFEEKKVGFKTEKRLRNQKLKKDSQSKNSNKSSKKRLRWPQNSQSDSKSQKDPFLEMMNISINTKQSEKVINLNAVANMEDRETKRTDRPDYTFFVKEEKKSGFISPKLIHKLLSQTFGYPLLVVCTFAAALSGVCRIQITEAHNTWGKDYFDPKNPHNNKAAFRNFYLSILLSIVLATCTVLPIYYSITWFGRKIHSKMTFRLLHSNPTKFLQRTPNGVILNRFSNDVNIIDNELMENFVPIVGTGMQFLVTLAQVLGSMPNLFAFLAVTVYLILALRMRQSYMRAQVEVKRLTLISKSPIIGTAVGSIGGGPVIRVLGGQDYLRKKIDFQIEENTKNMLMFNGLDNWFFCLQDLCKLFIILWPLYCLMLLSQYRSHEGDKHLVSQIQFIEMLSGQFFGTLLGTTNLEKGLISVERLHQYENLEPETGYKRIFEDEELFADINKSKLKKIKNFLEQKEEEKLSSELLVREGEIRMCGVSARYPTSKSYVLKNLDLVIPAGQRVGIVGRTGAGKSSFIKLLWRALDPHFGRIELDSIDLRDLDVKEYRKEINVILQKPCLFEGTLLSNISPLETSQHKIEALRRDLIDLGFPISKLQNSGLSFAVSEGGSNLSQSEKQIICLMQALQKEAKIVILDEATAYVDTGLERKFQERLAERFRDSTMVFIAHRMSNVVDLDRVLVFDQGRVVEDGDPRELIESEKGHFYEIWRRG